MESDNYWKRTMRRNITRRRFVQVAALGAAGVSLDLIGCGSQTTTDKGQEAKPAVTAVSTPAPTPTSGPVKGGRLTVAVPTDLMPGPGPFALSAANNWIYGNVYDRLIYYGNDDLKPIPALAESWKFSADFTSLTLKIRSGVKFHSGRTLTAEDIKWNIEAARDPKAGTHMQLFSKWPQKIDTPDPSTVVLDFGQPRPSFLDFFSLLPIADRETLDDFRAGKKIVGTGAFIFKEWVPGDHHTMVRNPDYWMKGRPYLDEVVVKTTPEAQSRILALQTGNADLVYNIDLRDVKSLESDKKYQVVQPKVITAYSVMGFQVHVPPFNDKRVRKAMSYLMDRKRICDTLLFYSQPKVIPWEKNSPAYDAELDSQEKYGYNPTKAKELLAQAGVPTHNPEIALGLMYPDLFGVGEMFQAELAKVGWKADLKKYDTGEVYAKIFSAQMGPIFIMLDGFIALDPSTLFFSTPLYRTPPPNSTGYDSPQYAKIVENMTKTGDPAELKKIYRQFNELLLDEAFEVPIATTNSPQVASAKLRDIVSPWRQSTYAGLMWKST